MAYRYTPEISLPLDPYVVSGDGFGKPCSFDGEDWGIHLGEDMNVSPGTPVRAIGRGHVVYAALHAGSATHRSWGNVVIIAHKHPATRTPFFSLSGHLQHLRIRKGNSVELGDVIAKVGKPLSPENGWWDPAHLHFAVYVGPWTGRVLPGYYRKDQPWTKRAWWVPPEEFVRAYPRWRGRSWKGDRGSSFLRRA